MDKVKFWEIIEFAKNNSNGNRLVQESVLIQRLSSLSEDAIIEFEILLRQFIIEADDYKVMAALKIIEGWVTDDDYLYFRCWLIGQGENTFFETIKNPEYLSKKKESVEAFFFEDLLYVATKAFKIVSGITDEDDSFPRGVALAKGLDYDFDAPPTKGDDWDEEDLPKLYPNLWAMFNSN